MERIIIVGARIDGHANVVLEIIQAQGIYEIVGFIDDNLYKKNVSIRGIPVIGTMSHLNKIKKDLEITGGIVAIGQNATRRHLASELHKKGIKLVNAVHPSAHLDSDVIIGNGNVFCQGVIIVTGTKIGNCVNIHTGATVDHNNIIKDGANLGPGVHTAGRVIIDKDAFLGTGTIVIPDIRIHKSSIVGAGSVVINSVQPYTLVVGVPAKFVKKLSNK